MKREIKFRGYDPDTKRWYFGSLVKQNKTTYVTSEDYDQNPSNTEWFIFWDEMTDWCLPNRHIQGSVDPESIGEYTGKHDKNGRKIYEGDLFEHRFGYIVFDDPPHDEMGTECGVVVLEDGQFGVKIPGLGVYNLYGLLLREGHLDNMPKDDLFVMKIAGNIYENPELLEADHE
ncbi:YopX family protein [Lacticaseibacillus paracasei]|uniref:YopX family protein n=1 Tax=Lacticaseibacillus paracasei TaxID=1597 RepID=UPI001EF513DF|nr:YopX family protein [Lacticaseibacillus paracasei]